MATIINHKQIEGLITASNEITLKLNYNDKNYEEISTILDEIHPMLHKLKQESLQIMYIEER